MASVAQSFQCLAAGRRCDTRCVVRAWTLLLLTVTGCYRASTLCVDDACPSPTDGDNGADAPEVCFGAHFVGNRCFTPPAAALFSSSQTLDTDTSPLCAAGEIVACFVVGTEIEIPANIRIDVIGTRPLVLWSATSISISGVLDGASHSEGQPKRGPGANEPNCNAADGLERGDVSPGIAAGGAGGAFGSTGGTGGSGRLNNDTTGGTGSSGVGPPAFRGGCDGGRGGFSPVAAGGGGGVVYLMAVGQITVSGLIDASGGGGAGGFFDMTTRGGGNGGGSGGLIGLEAPSIDLANARLVALGGGGGSGAGQVAGNTGRDPQISPAVNAALGGVQTVNANAGGDGSSGDNAGLDGGSVVTVTGGGGGGGGGGAGFIISFSEPINTSNSVIVPAL